MSQGVRVSGALSRKTESELVYQVSRPLLRNLFSQPASHDESYCYYASITSDVHLDFEQVTEKEL